MANNIAFQPMGPCVLVQPSAANTQSNVITITAFSPVQQYSLINTDTNNAVFIEISASPTFNVAVPTSAGSNVYPVPAFGYQVITGPQVSQFANVYVRAISASGTPAVYVTPGEGL